MTQYFYIHFRFSSAPLSESRTMNIDHFLSFVYAQGTKFFKEKALTTIGCVG